MLVLKQDPQITLWEAVMPSELLTLNNELTKVDIFLDDKVFIAPFLERFNTRIGRPTIPVETFIRLMYLKYRYQLGFEVLVEEVSDSIKWRRFCRIPLDKKVPHSTTLIKLTKRYGPETINAMNEALIRKAKEKKIIRARKLRIDTTAIESDIHYPTDASLLADGVRTITKTVTKLKELGAAARTTFRDRTRSTKKRILSIAKLTKRRTNQTHDEVRAITGDIMDIAQATLKEADRVLKNTRHYAWRKGEDLDRSIKGTARKLQRVMEQTEQIIRQTSAVNQGNVRLPNRIISIFDPDARPIRRGKVKAPTEFGYKVLLSESEEKIITDYQVLNGNPADDTLLKFAVTKHSQKTGRVPWAVATDRGFGGSDNEQFLKELGVKRCSLPRKGKLSKSRKEYQSHNWFKRLQRWRAGGEATISLLKRKYGLNRSRFRGSNGTKAWVGFGIMAYNLRRIASLM